jgi:hypothetical protein
MNVNEFKSTTKTLLQLAEETRTDLTEKKEPNTEFEVSATVDYTDALEDNGYDPTILKDFRNTSGIVYYQSSLYISYQTKSTSRDKVVSISPGKGEFKLKDFKKGKVIKFVSEEGYEWTFTVK